MKKDIIFMTQLVEIEVCQQKCLFVCACVYISFRDLGNICSPNTGRENKLEIINFRQRGYWPIVSVAIELCCVTVNDPLVFLVCLFVYISVYYAYKDNTQFNLKVLNYCQLLVSLRNTQLKKHKI